MAIDFSDLGAGTAPKRALINFDDLRANPSGRIDFSDLEVAPRKRLDFSDLSATPTEPSRDVPRPEVFERVKTEGKRLLELSFPKPPTKIPKTLQEAKEATRFLQPQPIPFLTAPLERELELEQSPPMRQLSEKIRGGVRKGLTPIIGETPAKVAAFLTPTTPSEIITTFLPVSAAAKGAKLTKRAVKTLAARKVGPIEGQFIRSGEATINSQGPAGKELTKLFQSSRRSQQIKTGTDIVENVKPLTKLSKVEQNAVVNLLDKGIVEPGLSKTAKKVAAKIKTRTDQTGDELEKLSRELNIQIDTAKGKRFFFKKKNFFPREPDLEVLKTAEGAADEAAHFLATGQSKTLQEARDVVTQIVNRGSPQLTEDAMRIIGTRHPRLAKEIKGERVYELKNIIRDPVVAYSRFFDRINRTIENLKHFGKGNERYLEKLVQIEAQGGNANLVTEIGDRLLGVEAPRVTAKLVSGNLRALQAFKLGLAQIVNLQQGFTGSWIRSKSFKIAAKAQLQVFKKSSKEFAERAGAIGNKAQEEYINQISGALRGGTLPQRAAGKFLTGTGFRATETADRVVAAVAGKDYLKSSLVPKLLKNPTNKFLRKEFETLGVDANKVLRNKGVDFADELAAGNEFSRQVNFAADPLELPVFWTTEWGKVITQFKTFGFGQTRLLNRMIKQDPVGTTGRLVIAGTMLGIPIKRLRELIRFKSSEEENTWASEVIGGFMTISGFGILSDMSESSKFGQAGEIGFFAGPSVADIADIVGPITAKDPRRLGRELTRRVPVVGSALANTIFPPKNKKKKSKFR